MPAITSICIFILLLSAYFVREVAGRCHALHYFSKNSGCAIGRAPGLLKRLPPYRRKFFYGL